MNILETLKENPELAGNVSLSIKAADLFEFARGLIESRRDEKPIIIQPKEKFITADEACAQLGVTRATLWNWEKKKILCPSKIGNNIRYAQSDIDALFARKKGQKVG